MTAPASVAKSAEQSMPKLRPAHVVHERSDLGPETEISDAALPSQHSSASPPMSTGEETIESPVHTHPRRERLRARQALQSSGSRKAVQHKPSTGGQKPSAAILGCLAAAALATACIGWWFKRRKLKRKARDAKHLFTKCKLTPSTAVSEAIPAPPLLSTTFVTTAA